MKTMQYPQGPSEPSAEMAVKRKHRIKEILLGFLLLIALIMITPAILSLFFRDIPPVSAPDLTLAKVTVPVADNAYYDLIKLEQSAVDVPESTGQAGFINGVLTGVRWDQTVVDEAIAKNTEALGYFADAAKKPTYQYPAYADPANIDLTKFESTWGWGITYQTAVLNAVNLQKQGKEQEAFQQALDIMHVGKIVLQSRSTLVGFLSGTHIRALGEQTLQRLLHETKLTAAELSPYTLQAQSLAAGAGGLTNALKMEYAFRTGYVNEAVLQDSTVQNEPPCAKSAGYQRSA